jgi:hypothetical protein
MRISFLLITTLLCYNFSFSQTTIIDASVSTNPNGSFENTTSSFAANGWTVVNDGTNYWIVSSTVANSGLNSAHITNNGTNNGYTKNTSQVSHFYRDVTFPASETCIQLSFNWRCDGELGYDFLKVYLINTSTTPTFGNQLPAANQLGVEYSSGSGWQTANITIPASNAGTTKRLVFSWRNDGNSGSNPAAAVDNISLISYPNPATPTCASYISPVNGFTTCSASQTLSWNAVSVPCGTAAYDVYFNSGTTASVLVSADQAGTTYNTGALANGTYAWKIVPKNGSISATGCTTYTFSVNTPANDLPCNATNITLGNIASGDNTCSSNAGEPATPGCWTGGTRNTVWYSFTAPPSGNVKIRTAPGTLLSTQIALYSGSCGPSLTQIGCNNDAPSCGLTVLSVSELSATGLSAGSTYYVAVDGENSLVGTFAITVIESSSSYPSSSGQSCSTSILACNSSISIGNPGYQGIGFTCDDDGSGNCTSGERGSVWYTINIQSNGNLNFSIIPNDYSAGSPGAETDYDFVLWKIAGTGSVSCTNIASGSAPVACNYSSYGVTGLAAGGNAPAPFSSSFNGSFEPTLAVASGDSYLLLIENFSNSSSGFTLDLSGTSAGVINYTPPTSITWTGGANTTTWTSSVNWGGCTTPACGVNANISNGSVFQPLITSAMGTVTVNNLTIDPGAVLTLGAGAVLKICGNFTNNGTLISDPTSTIYFNDNLTHSLNGALNGLSNIGNLLISDVAGGANCRVIANSDLNISGNLTTNNITSIFDINGKSISLSGNLINAAGANTFSNTSSSTITFNGTGAQIYNPNNNSATPTLTLNNVTMNNTGTGVTLSTTNTPNMVLSTNGALTLTSGKIVTPNTQEVVILNTNPAAVTSGNTTSYVEGNLRRYLSANATGSFDFPIGHATPGYERANINFTTPAAATALQLVARFDPWGGAWPMPGAPNWSECSATYNDPFLNNGYWSIDASAVSTGKYNLTLFNRSYTTSSAGFSIAKSPSSSPAWSINGNCVNSPVTGVIRNDMTGFSKFATIQGNAPLPVQLILFTGTNENTYNNIYWSSAVEVNFRYYELESSEDGITFTKIATVNPIGNMSQTNNYTYYDFNRFENITYYRLKMIDLDYSYEYSRIISIENNNSKPENCVVYPNPASTELFIKLSVPGETEANVKIIDVLGREIFNQKIDLTQNIDNTYINTTTFVSGTYFVTITSGDNFIKTNKIVVKHND